MKQIVAKGIYYDALYNALAQTNWYDFMEEEVSIAIKDYLSIFNEPMSDSQDESHDFYYSKLDEFWIGTLELLRKISDGCLSRENDEAYK